MKLVLLLALVIGDFGCHRHVRVNRPTRSPDGCRVDDPHNTYKDCVLHAVYERRGT